MICKWKDTWLGPAVGLVAMLYLAGVKGMLFSFVNIGRIRGILVKIPLFPFREEKT